MKDIGNSFAIVGIGCRLPGGADDADSFWQLLAGGRDAIGEIPEDRPDWRRLYDPDPAAAGRIYTRLGGFIDGIDQFDPHFFGISPREASRIDPQQRLMLEVVAQAFEDASIPIASAAGTETGVFVGISTHDYADVQMYPENRESIDSHSNTGGATSITANRVSYVFDFRGPSMTVDTACSSALTAVHLACRALAAGDCTQAIAGGVQLLLRPELTVGFCRATMLSVDGHCKAFDESGNGYVRSEGAGAVLLKPLAAALEAGDRIYAVIRGTAVNQDGRSPGLTVPSGEAQQAMLRTSLARAGLSPTEVQYVEAHGTGTAVGDPIEAGAIGAVFAPGRTEPLRLGSVKTNIGHLEAASGIAGLIKTTLALHHRQIPASLHFNRWNPAIDAEALKLHVTTALEPWPETASGPAAAINSFGFGGANASVVLGAAPEPVHQAVMPAARGPELFVVSARSPESLKALARANSAAVADTTVPLGALCGTAALGRSHYEHRLAVVGSTPSEIADGLDAFTTGDATPLVVSGRTGSESGKLAYVFAGMGPQWWAMGRQLLGTDGVFRATMERCDASLAPYSGWSLIEEFLADEAHSRIAHPQLAQVTNFALQVSLAAMWKEWGIRPDAVLGHSGGAMAAAYEAGVHTLDDAIRLAFHRSRMQGRDSNSGEMLAVGLPAAEAPELIRGHESEVSLAAVNGPSAMTLAGNGEVLRAIAARLTEKQVFARMLAVTIAYHSPRMDPIRDEFLATMAGLPSQSATLPFVSDTTGTWEDGAGCDEQYWWRAIRSPVRFADSIFTLIDSGHTRFLEISPHPVLLTSINECLAARGVKGLAVPSLRRNENERAMMLKGLGTFYVNGTEPDWESLYQRDAGVKLPLYPFQRERHWFEPKAGSAGPAETVGEEDPNPLLGRRLPSAQPAWEMQFGDPRMAYLDDHLIQDAVIFPGAGYVAMALAAARRLDPKATPAVRDVEFLRPLVLTDRAATRAQVSVSADTGAVEIFAGAGGDRASWNRYSTARISRGRGGEGAPLDLAGVAGRLGPAQPVDAFYSRLRRRGLGYGPAFKGLTELHATGREVLARIGPVPGLEVSDDGPHPALLDAAFQLLAAAAMSANEADTRLFLPISIGEVRQHGQVGEGFWAHCRLDDEGTSKVTGSITLYGDDGAPLLTVRDLAARLVENDSAGAEALDRWLYQYQWEPALLVAGREPPPRLNSPLPAATMLDGAGADWIAAVERETDWPRYYRTAEPVLTRQAARHVLRAFAELGLPADPGARITDEQIAGLRDKEPSGGRWTDRLLALLEEAGALSRVEGSFALRDLGADEALPGYETDLALLAEAGRSLATSLRGGNDGRDGIFTSETLPLLTRFYSEAPASAFYNRVLAGTLDQLVRSGAAGGHLRVLEVGAGTGGAAAAALAVLPPERTTYVCTDSAPLLLDAARERFVGVPNLQTAILDITAPLDGQGFVEASFDLVIAANVVHATADIGETLARLRSLLVPGGSLVLLEITRHPRWLDVIFGQTRGWWAFTDRALRPEQPLLERAQWRAALEAAGFTAQWQSPEPGALGEHAQSVLVATRAPETTEEKPWILVGEAPELQGALEALGSPVRTVEIRDLPALLDTLAEPPRGLVHLGGLTGGDFAAAQEAGVHAALKLVQAVLARPHLRQTPIALVTAGATGVAGDAVDNVLQSPIWGLGRTVMKETPDLDLRLIDAGDARDNLQLGALVSELTEPGQEEEICLRAGARYVHRLRRTPLETLPVLSAPAEHDGAWRAEIGRQGSIKSLLVRGFSPVMPEPGEVQIAVRAASLNFRDVMLAMGGIPGLEDEMSFGHRHLGSDCAGVVTAVGAGVEGFAVGDAVMAMAPGSLATLTTTSQALVARKPDAWSFADAAAAPTVFLTAWYALVEQARLRKGERVLIHAATGGVGLAAIQIAQQIGAEIFATAGSDSKRELLRSLGITHVMDSRALSFADEIAAMTGGRGVDVVLNSLAGEAIERGIASLAPYGRFVEIGKMDIYTNRALQLGRFRQNLSYFAVDLDRLCAERPDRVGEMLAQLAEEFAAGRLRPVRQQRFAFAELEDAFLLMAQARHIGKIVIEEFDVLPANSAAPTLAERLRPDRSYLVTGGLTGFGLEVADHLAAAGAGAIVLMGRREPGPEAIRRIDLMRARGARVEVMRGDVSVPDALQALACIDAELPPLAGVIHGAMTLDDRRIEDMDAASLDRVLAGKALGAWNLHRATLDRQLELFVMFSSITSLLGNPLQANYGAAGAFLDALAHHRRALGKPALTINWGVLADSGYVAERPELHAFLEQQGYNAFSMREALGILDTVAGRDTPQLMAAAIDWRRLAAYSPRAAASPRVAELVPAAEAAASASMPQSAIMAELLAGSEAERPAIVEAFLARALQRVLGIRAEDIDPERGFDELGLDSLLSVELLMVLTTELGFEIPAIALLDGMSVRKLGGLVLAATDLSGAGAAPASAPVRVAAEAPPAAAPVPTPPPAPRHEDPPAAKAPEPAAPPQPVRSTPIPPILLPPQPWTPLQKVARGVCRVGFGLLGAVEVEGLENLPDGPFILAVNHLSMADVPLALTILPRKTVILANERLRSSPVLDWLVGGVGQAIYVRKKADTAAALDRALRVLEQGSVIALAPEGTRSPAGLKRAETGVAWLAAKSGRPVVPYVAWGQEQWRERGRRRIPMHVRIGTPIPPPAGDREAQLRDYADGVMVELARLLPPSYRGHYAGQVTEDAAE